jgi:hypothetical protein
MKNKMSEHTTHTLKLDGKHRQLVDLNKDYSNFETKYTITPHTLDLGKNFSIAVVSQSALDGDSAPKMTSVNGIYSNTITVDDPNSQYENYFLILQSTEELREMKVDVEIRPLQQQQQTHNINKRMIGNERELDIIPMRKEVEPELFTQPPPAPAPPAKNSNLYYKILIALFLLIAGGFLAYYFYKKSKNINISTPSVAIPSISPPSLTVPKPVIQAPPEIKSSLRKPVNAFSFDDRKKSTFLNNIPSKAKSPFHSSSNTHLKTPSKTPSFFNTKNSKKMDLLSSSSSSSSTSSGSLFAKKSVRNKNSTFSFQ